MDETKGTTTTAIPVPTAFEAATNTLPHRPPDVGSFWSAWLMNAQPKRVRRDVLQTMAVRYPGFIQVYVFGGVAGVISDWCLREIIPTALLFAEPLDLSAVKTWLASTKGYVIEPVLFRTERAR